MGILELTYKYPGCGEWASDRECCEFCGKDNSAAAMNVKVEGNTITISETISPELEK